ncbi:DnaT-like ssDNA-binding protein [Wielerella bovis]|uniref:DnaT-like ssDNA-binding protein n=1 Tax=Wielerella bovis TaxID=2917790 RepID=UPI002018E6E7|nr:DnaT-like ssDNA-binding protein [Wielerella bovis]ULJ65934.1 hypothetical protein MIS31_06530 [Wielerella bovis]
MLAESYVSLNEADDYHNARQTANVWDDFSPTQKQQRLVSASDWIDRLSDYIGQPENPTQNRAFPRILPPETVAVTPVAIKQACCELALLDDISGSLPNAVRIKNIGGVLLENGECSGDEKALHMALQAALLLLQPYRRINKSVRLERG